MVVRAPVALAALTRISVTVVVMTTVAGCVYFNALYNSQRLFNRGRKQIEAGNEATGRSTLGISIEKAERILDRSPDSRWADDALSLIVRARLLREEWEEAAQSSRRLLQMAATPRDSARAAGYLGIAEGQLGNPELADSLITMALTVAKDRDERAALLLHRGRARLALDRLAEADEDLQAVSRLKKNWITPRLGRVDLLARTEQFDEAADEFARVLEVGTRAPEEQAVVEAAERLATGSAQTALRALAELESANLRSANLARLMKLRGDLRVRVGKPEEGKADYRRTIEIAPNSAAAVDAYYEQARLELEGAAWPDDLEGPRVLLERAVRIPRARTVLELHDLLKAVRRSEYWIRLGDLGYMAAAEAARDEMRAPALARYLFLEYARKKPDDLWAAKAILAALDLTSVDSGPRSDGAVEEPTREELQRWLREDYQGTAYVQAILGGNSAEFTYEELETGLRRHLQRLVRLADQELTRRR
ncbi:MAG: hypothetical protein V3T08_04805 [Gemmatimonadota bacterium]